MKKAMKTIALTAALAVSTAFAPSLFALSPQYQTHDQNQNQNHDQNQTGDHFQEHSSYYGNSYYRLGNKEGYQDYHNKTQRTEHNHKYRSDDDKRAYDYGYQDGLQGHRYNDHTDNGPH